MKKTFSKSFTQQEMIPTQGIDAAVNVMQSGRLHRYNTLPNELSETDLLEIEFANYLGLPYCLSCASGGYALHIALRAADIEPGDKVLCNAFTLAPVAGSIHNSGGIPLLVETDDNLCIDLEDLAIKASADDVRFFMLSHMRGHIADMDRIMDICEQHDLLLIEDCAHTMGASWNGQKSGTFGDIACFSTQTYKHINSGEGGLLCCSNDQIMAKAIIHSGSYMLFEHHQASPNKSTFDHIKLNTPNYSGRMDNLRAAILRPQLAGLDQQCVRWNERYAVLVNILGLSPVISLVQRPKKEEFVASSIQFSLPSASVNEIENIICQCQERGVTLKWFGNNEPEGYTSRYDSWQYINGMPTLPKTQKILSTLLDMRIPLTFSHDDCKLVAEIICDVVEEILT